MHLLEQQPIIIIPTSLVADTAMAVMDTEVTRLVAGTETDMDMATALEADMDMAIALETDMVMVAIALETDMAMVAMDLETAMDTAPEVMV